MITEGKSLKQRVRPATLVLLLGLLQWPVPGHVAPILDPSQIHEHTLANGLHIIVKEERGWGVVAVGAFIRCGSLHDPPGLPGMAHFIEHMLFRGRGADGQPSELVAAVEGLSLIHI